MPLTYLPLKALNSCDACGSVENLRLCGQCAERSYCSTECQKRDWKSHKTTCKTDRIDLSTFYPLLALLIESSRMRTGGKHPALEGRIINSPNPYTAASDLPDGTSARLVAVGPRLDHYDWRPDFSGWWPMGNTATIRGKLLRRIVREGKTLPLVVSACLSLLLSIYSTTTSGDPKSQHRIRLRYRSSPISDFGVVAGSARVTPDDQLAYILPDKTILKGQDPNDHYWIYFRTIKGEEVMLDCSMFTFNMCLVVETAPYDSPRTAQFLTQYAPAWFKDRTMTRNLPADAPLLTERRRFSVLQDANLRRAGERINIRADDNVSIPQSAADAINEFLTKVADGPVDQLQNDICLVSMIHGINVILDATVRSDAWKRYPAEPPMLIEGDPGEL